MITWQWQDIIGELRRKAARSHAGTDPGGTARREVVGGLLEDEPWLEADVAFGIGATDLLDVRLGGKTHEQFIQLSRRGA